MAEERARRWFSLSDKPVAVIGIALMTSAFLMLILAFFGPVWIQMVVSTAVKPASRQLEISDNVTHVTTAGLPGLTSPDANVTSSDVDRSAEYVVENLWYICKESTGCLSREEHSHKGTLSAAWMMTFSILFLAIADGFAIGFWYKVCVPKKFRWAMNTSAAVFGFGSGFCTLGAVIGFVIFRYQEAAKDPVLSIRFGWSFFLAVLQLPPVFASSIVFMFGHRNNVPHSKRQKESSTTPLTA